MATSAIKTPDIQTLLGNILPALPPAALSKTPAENVLPLLSPILRQRVRLLASSSTEPWLRLLCYDTSKIAKLSEIVQGDRLEPHPVSGEIEIDWDYDSEIRYRRIDQETLQGLVAVKDMELAFQLVYCVNDEAGGGDGWRVGEVSVTDKPSPFSSFGGVSSIAEADRQFQQTQTSRTLQAPKANSQAALDDEDDDDDYWARYDATPARTPAQKQSPAPQATQTNHGQPSFRSPSAEDAYFSQYDSVQPAMDNHDPDEDAGLPDIAPPLGLGQRTSKPAQEPSEEESELNETQGAWTLAGPPKSPSLNSRSGDDPNIAHPRPRSPADSAGSSADSVAKLEAAAAKRDQLEFGVKQHISRDIKNLFMLSRASGIDREEFARIVKTELDMLEMLED